ncbi:glycosyl hydrolase catalytic core-domain-containing protein, partial [Mycena leptocephala]
YGTNATAFKEFLVNYHDVFQINIWVTEWACQNMQGPQNQCSMRNVTEFMSETRDFMNQMEWVERYAWYGAKTPADMHGVNAVGSPQETHLLCWKLMRCIQSNAMMDTNGLINDLGRQLISRSKQVRVTTAV